MARIKKKPKKWAHKVNGRHRVRGWGRMHRGRLSKHGHRSKFVRTKVGSSYSPILNRIRRQTLDKMVHMTPRGGFYKPIARYRKSVYASAMALARKRIYSDLVRHIHSFVPR